MQIGLFEILGIVAVIQLFLLCLFLFTLKKGNRLSNQLLGVFLLCNALVLLDVMQLHSGLFLTFPHLVSAGFSTTLLFGPLLFLYTISTRKPQYTMKWKNLLHGLPFVIHWIVVLPTFFLVDAETKIEMINSGFIFSSDISVIGYVIIHLHVIIYLILSISQLSAHKPDNSSKRKLSWLKITLFGFLFMWSSDLCLVLTAETLPIPNQVGIAFQFLAVLIYFLFVNIAVFHTLKQPELLTTQKLKYANSYLNDDDRVLLIQQVQSYMQSHKPYLDASVTIEDMANYLNTSSRNLSQAINETYNQNFTEFINRYRIEKAKSILQNNADPKITVLEVMYKVGFNSKSAFNTAFKKYTGTTPSSFKKPTS